MGLGKVLIASQSLLSILTPKASSNITNYGIISDSRNSNNAYLNFGKGAVRSPLKTYWCQIEFNEPKCVKGISFFQKEYDPSYSELLEIKLSASNDGINFIDLGSCSSDGWSAYATIKNIKKYKFYRFQSVRTTNLYDGGYMCGLMLLG